MSTTIRLQKYETQHAEIRDQMEAILATADEATDGDLTAEQQTAFDGLQGQLTAVNEKIAREKAKIDADKSAPVVISGNGNGTSPDLPARATDVKARAEDDAKKGFSDHRAFLLATIENSGFTAREDVPDERLRPLAVLDQNDKRAAGELAFMLPEAFTPSGLKAAAGSDEQGAYDDRYGGFSVRPTFLPGMLQLGFEGDPTAGRTQPVPMSSPVVEMLARTDKNHTSSVSGGFTVTRRPETVSAPSSRMEMEKVTLKATSLFGLAYTSEEILTDSVVSFVAIVDAGFRDQFAHHMLDEKIRGLGGSEYQGVLDALAASSKGCTISIAKETNQEATTIETNNVLKMRARCWGYGNAIWIANHDSYPQLAVLSVDVGTGGTTIYQQSIREDRPDMLLGRPIFYSEYPATLGSQGDLILGNWSQYLDALYQPLQSAESVHVRFVNHERTFKFWLRNAGAPWWRSALTPQQSSDTLSPFVVLDARA